METTTINPSTEMATNHFISGFQYPEILVLIGFTLAIFIYYKKYCRKTLVPIHYPIIGMVPALLVHIHHLHEWATDILRQNGTFKFYGPWFLGMDFIATSDPANVNHIFNVNHANYPKGDEFLQMFDVLGDGIFNADHESWKMQRKMAHAVMSTPNFRSFVVKSSRDKVENGLIPLVKELAQEGAVFDLQDIFLRLTFDMTCILVFGVNPKALSKEFPTVPFARAMDDGMEALFYRHAMPPFCWKFLRWLSVGRERKFLEARLVIDDFVAQNIAVKRESKMYGEDILTSYIKAEGAINDDRFLRDTAVNLMLAGRDTTGVALSWFFWLLSRNPEVKVKLLEEINQNCTNKEFDFSKMVYLHAALLEALRLYPSVPFEHKAPLKEEVLPSGHKTVVGERIPFLTYSMGRMEGVWGKDCLEFRPERWITEKGNIRHEPSYKFLSFNAGPRTCLGKEIAFVQLKTTVVAMMRNFDVEVEKDCVVEPKHSIILHMKNGLMVRTKWKEDRK